MSFCKFSKDYISNNKTIVDNIFILNYLVDADSDCLKVYLYGLFLCQNNKSDIDIEEMSSELNISVDNIKKSYQYWEELGLINLYYDPFMVVYLPIDETGYKYKKYKPEKYEDFNKTLQILITGRMISINEYQEYFYLIENYNIKPEAVLMIVKYCIDLKGDNISYKYIATVIKDFISRGLTTIDLVDKELSKYISFSAELQDLFIAMNIKRKPEVDDLQDYNKWTQNYGYDLLILKNIIKICKVKNVKKLNIIVEELYANKCYETNEIIEFIKNKNKNIELTFEINKALGLYYESVDNEVNTYTLPWLSKGYNHDTLVFIANYCFRHNKRTLDQMNSIIEKIYSLGLITIENITDYIEKRNEDDKIIISLFEILSISRKINDWDRTNLKNWRSWNFTDDMILEAGKIALGKNNPLIYINAILSNWKAQNIFTKSQITKIKNKNDMSIIGPRFGYERNYTSEELDKIISSVDDIEV